MRAALALGASLAAIPAAAIADPQAWLARLSEATVTVSYHGEVTHRHGDRVQSYEIARRAGPGRYSERILTLTGSPREVVRDGMTVTCVLPAGGRVPQNPFPLDGWSEPAALAANYELDELGDDRVAGRACRVLDVRARDGFRYGYRLLIDDDTWLLLRSDTLDEQGRVVEQVAFTRVETPAALDARVLRATLDGEPVRWRVGDDPPVQRTDLPWRVTALPRGFVAARVRERERGTTQQVFTDGLARVSVFVAPLGPDARPALAGASRMGAVSAFGIVIDGRQVTAVGEVPPATVQLIAESVVFLPR